jgi:uncharacterized protein YaiE (UPF0345 family)
VRNTYFTFNGAMTTTAALVPTATGTAIETHLQILPLAPLRVLEWGISFDGTAAATPIRCELVHTGTVAATVTAHVAAGVQPFNDSNITAAPVTLSTEGTGYNASAEDTTVATRYGDLQLIAPTNQYVKQFPLGEEFQVPANGVLRVRTTSTASVGCYCYVIFSA